MCKQSEGWEMHVEKLTASSVFSTPPFISAPNSRPTCIRLVSKHGHVAWRCGEERSKRTSLEVKEKSCLLFQGDGS